MNSSVCRSSKKLIGIVAKEFSDKLANRRFSKMTAEKDDEGNAITEPTTFGLSALAIEEIGGLVKKFNEKSAGLSDFSDVMNTVMAGGIVDYGNKGSEFAPEEEEVLPAPKNIQEARKQFSDKVNQIAEKDSLDINAAVVEAAKQFPELYEQYMAPAHR
jgi:hypothetical protein